MALQLTKIEDGFLSFTINANQDDNVKWYACKKVGGNYIVDPSIAIAKYENILNGDGEKVDVEWGVMTENENTGVINITAYSDSMTIYISAVNGSNETALLSFDPYQLYIKTTSSKLLSSTLKLGYRKHNTDVFLDLLDAGEFKWEIDRNIPGLSAYIHLDDYVYNLNTTNTFFTILPDDEEVYFKYSEDSGSNIAVGVTAGYVNNPYLSNPSTSANFSITQPSKTIYFNSDISVNGHVDDSGFITISALAAGGLLPGDNAISWNIDDSTRVIAFSGTSLNSPYTFGHIGTNLSVIKLSSSDLTRTYEYYLRDYRGDVYGTYRPQMPTLSATTLSAKLLEKNQDYNTGEYTYKYKAIGKTGSVFHSLPASQHILWNYNGDKDIILYNALKDVYYVPNSDSIAADIDTITIKINPEISNDSPKIFTENFLLSSGSPGKTHNFNITYSGFVDNVNLNPIFKFQYEDMDMDTIYRPLTSTAVYALSNTSIIPPNSKGAVTFTINNTVCSIPFSPTTNPTTGIKYTFHANTPQVCTVSIAVCASAVDYETFVYKKSKSTNIIFTDIPDASKFKAYPEYTWNENIGDWSRVVNGNSIILPSTPLSSYGMNHTERFFLSAKPLPLTGNYRWDWAIQNSNAENDLFNAKSSDNITWLPVKTRSYDTYTMKISASIFNSILTENMPSKYYDTPGGIKFANFYTTDDDHIKIRGVDNLVVDSRINNINTYELPIPGYMYITGSCNMANTSTPFDITVNTFNVDLSTSFWVGKYNGYISNNKMLGDIQIKVDDTGSSIYSLPKNEKSSILLKPSPVFGIRLKKKHPLVDDWEFNAIPTSAFITNNIVSTITAYPYTPLVYVPNYINIKNEDVIFENLIQCIPTVSGYNEWDDRNESSILDTCSHYTTSFDDEGVYDITLRNVYKLNDEIHSDTNTFTDIVEIREEHNLFNPDISRIYKKTNLKFPYTLNDCKIPPNEWITEDTFNSSMNKLHNNLQYLDNMSKLYSDPPTRYVGWLGAMKYNDDNARVRWYTNTHLNNYSYKNPERAEEDGWYGDLRACCVKGNLVYIANNNSINIRNNDFNCSDVSKRTYKSINDEFNYIRNIRIGEDDRIYVLDSFDPKHYEYGSRNRMLVFSYTNDKWILLYEWGGLGGEKANSRFNMPVDFCLDGNDNVIVADAGNKCIKKFTKTGGWISTISSDYFKEKEIISITNGINDDVFILTSFGVYVFDKNNNFINIFYIEEDAIKIESCVDGGFIYAIHKDNIKKYDLSGNLIGIFANDEFDKEYNKDYRGAFHDEHRNLYIVNNNHILKYVDALTVISLKNSDSNIWELNDIKVHKDEYVQDWVIVRCFHRFWDNIEIFRRSINGKFDYKIFNVITQNEITVPHNPPDDFDYCEFDWLHDSKTIIEESVYEYSRPVVRTFTESEYYDSLPYNKKDLIIGLNEIHSADVYNRSISRLYGCLEIVLEMIK